MSFWSWLSGLFRKRPVNKTVSRSYTKIPSNYNSRRNTRKNHAIRMIKEDERKKLLKYNTHLRNKFGGIGPSQFLDNGTKAMQKGKERKYICDEYTKFYESLPEYKERAESLQESDGELSGCITAQGRTLSEYITNLMKYTKKFIDRLSNPDKNIYKVQKPAFEGENSYPECTRYLSMCMSDTLRYISSVAEGRIIKGTKIYRGIPHVGIIYVKLFKDTELIRRLKNEDPPPLPPKNAEKCAGRGSSRRGSSGRGSSRRVSSRRVSSGRGSSRSFISEDA